MTTEEILRYVMSFLGGGVVVAVGNWVHATRSAQRQNELDRLREQLASLYGPCFFFTCQNEKMLCLSASIQKAYSTSFEGKSWSDDPSTQATLRKEMTDTVDLANEYVLRVDKNNARVMELLERNWHLVDSEDVPIFSHFQVDYTRSQTEIHGRMRSRMPPSILAQVGNISFMRPEMIERVRSKVEAKQAQIAGLLNPWWRCSR